MNRLSFGFCVAMALACGFAGKGAAGETPAEESFGWIPDEVELDGVIARIEGRTLLLDTEDGRVRVRVPTDLATLLYDDGSPVAAEDFWIEDLAELVPGDGVYVDGSLQTDGTVVAYELDYTYGGDVPENDVVVTLDGGSPAGGAPGDFETRVEGNAIGVCTAAVADTITVDGTTLRVVPDSPADPDAAYVRGGTPISHVRDAWRAAGGPIVRVGDNVGARWLRTDDGRLVATRIALRPSGDGASLRGTVRSFDAAASEMVVDGVTVRLDRQSRVRRRVGRALADSASGADAVGLVARVAGVLRDGVLYADDVRLGAAATRPRRPGRMHAFGVVTDAGRKAMAVNGLALRLPRGLARKAKLGLRVRADVKLRGDGLVATAVASRR